MCVCVYVRFSVCVCEVGESVLNQEEALDFIMVSVVKEGWLLWPVDRSQYISVLKLTTLSP